jgi:hypothetical protein
MTAPLLAEGLEPRGEVFLGVAHALRATHVAREDFAACGAYADAEPLTDALEFLRDQR